MRRFIVKLLLRHASHRESSGDCITKFDICNGILGRLSRVLYFQISLDTSATVTTGVITTVAAGVITTATKRVITTVTTR